MIVRTRCTPLPCEAEFVTGGQSGGGGPSVGTVPTTRLWSPDEASNSRMASGILGLVPDCRFCAVSSTTTGFDAHPAQQISLIFTRGNNQASKSVQPSQRRNTLTTA